MQNQAEERYRTKIKDLEKSLSDTQTKLSELQRNRDTSQGQRFVLSPEQQAEIKKFQAKQAEANRELRQERRNLRRDIDSLENRLKWMNIAGMPLLVAISGIALALMKQKDQQNESKTTHLLFVLVVIPAGLALHQQPSDILLEICRQFRGQRCCRTSR